MSKLTPTKATLAAPATTPAQLGDTKDHIAAQTAADAEVAEAATALAAKENRLPSTGAVTNPAPATIMDAASGAFVETAIIKGIPVDHPAVDNNPRAGTSAIQNGADFNDPTGRLPSDVEFAGQGLDLNAYGDAAK